ncbi:unnamed protein product, partial [Polarella glacialis]
LSDGGASSEEGDGMNYGRRNSDFASGNALGFIDRVSDGINNYLGALQGKGTGSCYAKHSGEEAKRWRDCLQGITEAAVAADRSRTQQDGSDDDSEDSQGNKKEKAKPAAIPLGRPEGPFDSKLLGPCAPPTDVVFEKPSTELFAGKSKLAFAASFESGNLSLARCDSATVYTLLLDFDVNTLGYTQWFYFGVQGGTKGVRVTFRLVNMAKSGSLFEKGMRPAVWSQKSGRGWERGGTSVRYVSNEPGRKKANSSSTLSFHYTFESDDDTVFFAYHWPYTYTYLQRFLGALADHPYAGNLFRRKVLCRTIGGLPCDMLEIGGDELSPTSRGQKVAVITARVHPGESNASWMMHGFLEFLLSPAPEACALRDAAKWIVVPMMNPDGVIQGNYRCGLAGLDLNRAFLTPHKKLHPTVWHLKEILQSRGVSTFIDLHGHSKKEGIFWYGGKANDDERNGHIQLIPRLCSMASDDFKWNRCSFNCTESKLTAARLVGFLQLNITHCYTVEASFSSSGGLLVENSEAENSEAVADSGVETQPGSTPVVAATSDEGQTESSDVAEVAEALSPPPEVELSTLDIHASLSEAVTAALLPTSRKPALSLGPAHGWNGRPSSAARVGGGRRQLIAEEKQYGKQYSKQDSLDDCHHSDSEEDLYGKNDPSSPVYSADLERFCVAKGIDDAEIKTDSMQEKGLKTPILEEPLSPQGMKQRPNLPASLEAAVKEVQEREETQDAVQRAVPEVERPAEAEDLGQQVAAGSDYSPSRLELAGVVIGRALCAAWQLELLQSSPAGLATVAAGLLEGSEAARWPHLHYDRITNEAARWELAKLISGRFAKKSEVDDAASAGSDSNPSGDGKPAAELARIHDRILRKLKRRKTKVLEAPAEVPEEVAYKIVVAFGKAMKIPLKKGERLPSKPANP